MLCRVRSLHFPIRHHDKDHDDDRDKIYSKDHDKIYCKDYDKDHDKGHDKDRDKDHSKGYERITVEITTRIMKTTTTITTTTTTTPHSSCQLDQTNQRPTQSGWVGTPTRCRPGRRARSVDHVHAGIWTLDSPFHLASSLAPKNQCRRVSLRKDYRYWDGSFSWGCREKPERRWVLDGQQGLACAARSNRPRIRGKHANGGGVWGRPIMRSGHSCP